MCRWTYRLWKTTRLKNHRNLLLNLQFNSPCSQWHHLYNLQYNSPRSLHRNQQPNPHLNLLCHLWHPWNHLCNQYLQHLHLSKSLYKLLPPLHPPLLKHPRAAAVA